MRLDGESSSASLRWEAEERDLWRLLAEQGYIEIHGGAQFNPGEAFSRGEQRARWLRRRWNEVVRHGWTGRIGS